MKPIQTITLDDTHYIEIYYDKLLESPRNQEPETKLCIREHRRYVFPNELSLDFDDKDKIKSLSKTYHVFPLDCYDHSIILFSISGSGMQDRFDTVRDCGYICVPKIRAHLGTKCDKELAQKIAEADIREYNQYLNGEVYDYRLYKITPPIIQDGKVYKVDPECIDSCHGLYDIKDIADHLSSSIHAETFLSSIK